MLADDALNQFPPVAADVALAPHHGDYLNMKGAEGHAPAVPNETSGAKSRSSSPSGYVLQPDGTLMLDANGQPIPTRRSGTIRSSRRSSRAGMRIIADQHPVREPDPAGSNRAGAASPRPPDITPASTGVSEEPASSECSDLAGAEHSEHDRRAQWTAFGDTGTDFALDSIFYHPNVRPYVCKQLIQRWFFQPEPRVCIAWPRLADDGPALWKV
jgi:hypothetical protein